MKNDKIKEIVSKIVRKKASKKDSVVTKTSDVTPNKLSTEHKMAKILVDFKRCIELLDL